MKQSTHTRARRINIDVFRRIIIHMYHHHAVVERAAVASSFACIIITPSSSVAAMAWYHVTRYRNWPPPILRSYGDLILLECAVAQRAWVWGKRRAFQLMRRWAADGCWVTVLPGKTCGTRPSPNAPVHLRWWSYLPDDLPHRRVIWPPEERLWMNHIWFGSTRLQQ